MSLEVAGLFAAAISALTQNINAAIEELASEAFI